MKLLRILLTIAILLLATPVHAERIGEVNVFVPGEQGESVEEVHEPAQGPVLPKGNPFVGIGPTDMGYCGDPVSGYGWDYDMVWPNEHRGVQEDRVFTITHTGIDIDMETGTPIWPAEDGIVVFAGWSSWGFGNLVVVAHGYTWQTFYAHLESVNVECGDYVAPWYMEPIGYSGRTGAATWPHLHLEVRNWQGAHDPMEYLPRSY